MKLLVRIALVVNILILGTGLYLHYKGYTSGQKITGIGVLFLAFILLPLFLYHRYRNKKLEDYMLNKEKINKIIDNLKM